MCSLVKGEKVAQHGKSQCLAKASGAGNESDIRRFINQLLDEAGFINKIVMLFDQFPEVFHTYWHEFAAFLQCYHLPKLILPCLAGGGYASLYHCMAVPRRDWSQFSRTLGKYRENFVAVREGG